jgi:hypothetical protein
LTEGLFISQLTAISNRMGKLQIMMLSSNLTLGACTVFGIRGGTEQPRYTIEQHLGSVEIRNYGPRTAAEANVTAGEIEARSAGFRKLAHYIFGGNVVHRGIPMTAPVSQQGQQIAMTAPVAQAGSGQGEWTIRFFLPRDLPEASAPEPLDRSIKIIAVPAATMAVKRFSGTPGTKAVAVARGELFEALRGSSWQVAGEPVAWFYDPPWTIPPLRRNEVAVEVKRR